MTRRLTKCDAHGVSIYKQKHPELEAPPDWPFGGQVDFKPSLAQRDNAKLGTRGRKWICIGDHLNPGGTWSGDYLIADLKDFETHSGRKRIRVYRTKAVSWQGDRRLCFPLFDAKERVRLNSLD